MVIKRLLIQIVGDGLTNQGYYMLEIVSVEQAKDRNSLLLIIQSALRIESYVLVLGVKRSQLKKGKNLSFKDMQVITMRLKN